MVDTLQKFGVPTGGADDRSGILQPKQKHRFRVRFINFGPISGGLEMTQQIITIDKPKLDINPVQLDSYNSKVFVQGKHTWSDITVTLRDDITNNVQKLIGSQVQKQMNHFEQTTPVAGINYKFTIIIEQMDGQNDTVLDQWVIEGCWILNFDWGSNDYADDAVLDLTMTIKYDNATLSDGIFPDFVFGLPGVRA